MMKHLKVVSVLAAAMLFAAGLALVLFHRQILPYALVWLDVGETPRRADAIFVLLGDDDVRPFAAAALYKTGFAPRIVFGATAQRPTKFIRPKHLLFRDVMVKRGVVESDIQFIGAGVDNTMRESEALRLYLRDHPDFRVLVLTTHFHTRRTRWSLRRSLGADAQRLHFVSSGHDSFDAYNWWEFDRGFELITSEYVKLVAYWILYGSFKWLIIMGLGSAVSVWVWRRARRDAESATIVSHQT